MRKLSSPVLLVIVIMIPAFLACPLHSTGLYMDFPTYFAAIDTFGIQLKIRQTDLQRDEGRTSVFAGGLSLRPKPGIRIGLSLLYPAMQREGHITHAVGDGVFRSTVRIHGDTLDTSGLFFRADARIPIGPKTSDPFSYGSLDVGSGLEYRRRTSLFMFRCAATYTLVGERQKVGDFIHRNFLLLALSIGFDLKESTSFSFSGFGMNFRGGDSREVYILSFRQRFSGELDMLFSGGLDAGDDEERVFDSFVSFSLVYRFRSGKVQDSGK